MQKNKVQNPMRFPIWKNPCMADYSAKGWTLVYNNTTQNIKTKKSRISMYLHSITKYKNKNLMTERFLFSPRTQPTLRIISLN